MIDEGEIEIGGAAAHSFEKPECSAVKIVARDNVRAAVEGIKRGRHRREPGGKSPAARAAFQIGDASFVSEPRRIDRARVIVAFVFPGTFLHVGRRRVNRRHDRAGRWDRVPVRREWRGWQIRVFLHVSDI